VTTQPIEAYLAALQKAFAKGDATEHTHRAALAALIEAVGGENVTATNEPKQTAVGAPDYIVRLGNAPIGHVEAKDIDVSLSKAEKTSQLVRYLDGLPNLVLTDYLEFRWYVEGDRRRVVRFADTDGDGIVIRPNGADELLQLLQDFISHKVRQPTSPRSLAEALSRSARILRDALLQAIKGEKAGGSLRSQLDAFRQVFVADLDEAAFADMYAQTIAYGLFSARVNHDPNSGAFDRMHASYEIPRTNPFLRRLFSEIAGPDLDPRLTWAVDDLAVLLDRTDMTRVLRDFGKETRRTDPVLHFYETFLASYDPKLREKRGIYYTPEPVVSYIVRSVDALLQSAFGLQEGLACTDRVITASAAGELGQTQQIETHKVIILDPAVGTGTFLQATVRLIHERIEASGLGGAWNEYVRLHLLPRLFGFELLMAPYTVAHMKLGLQLKMENYDFAEDERLRVYLTNALDEAKPIGELMAFQQILAKEASEAGAIKQQAPVMVVLGNPPYSGHSANNHPWISRLIADYKHGFPELNKPGQGKWLNDDYVKFIRFGQWRIERTGHGILAFVTNHSWLSNATFRGMRNSLRGTFDDIYLLDLHGSIKPKEDGPADDENVFDIQKGVAIVLMVRRPGTVEQRSARIHHADLWGPREEWTVAAGERTLTGGKYRWLNDHDVTTTEWIELTPSAPMHLFKPAGGPLEDEYRFFIPLPAIFSPNGAPAPGFLTTQDQFAISFTADEAISKVERLLATGSEAEARTFFRLCSTSQWSYAKAKDQLLKKDWRAEKQRVLYRPFDRRWTIWDGNVTVHRRERAMRHMVGHENLALVTTRQTKAPFTASVATLPAAHKSAAAFDVNFVFPLWRFAPEDEGVAWTGPERQANLDREIMGRWAAALGMVYDDQLGESDNTTNVLTPRRVFDYLFAVLSSTTYRSRYDALLRIDYPRVPLVVDRALFERLAELGRDLVDVNTLTKPTAPVVSFPISGSNVVDHVKFVPGDDAAFGQMSINDTQHFSNVPDWLWGMEIGGYKVLDKWLKDRRGRTLSWDDIVAFSQMTGALAASADLIGQIELALDGAGAWPFASIELEASAATA
jgi:hypothetical protein